MFVLPNSKYGLGIDSLKYLHKKMILVKRHTLQKSKSDDIVQLWSSTQKCAITVDSLLATNTSVRSAVKQMKKEQTDLAMLQLSSLQIQEALVKTVIDIMCKGNVKLWAKTTEKGASIIF